MKLPDKNYNSHGRVADTEISGRVRLTCCNFYAAHVSSLRKIIFQIISVVSPGLRSPSSYLPNWVRWSLVTL